MLRDIDINEISDGKLLSADSMARIGCNDCSGCSECCHVVGDSIILDPYDINELTKATKMSFLELMNSHIELGVVDGILAPHIKVYDNKGCGFLNDDGRCSIHLFRPGFCRLFPLGRIYREDGSGFDYFVQTKECPHENKTKIKVKHWLGIERLKEYEEYINRWHSFLKTMQGYMKNGSEEENNTLNKIILNTFFITAYDKNKDIYESIYERIDKILDAFN